MVPVGLVPVPLLLGMVGPVVGLAPVETVPVGTAKGTRGPALGRVWT